MERHKRTVDIVLYVALSEEFVVILKELGNEFKSFELSDIALTCFLGPIRSEELHKTFQVLVVPAGKMGITRAANVTSAILSRFQPKDVAVIGIAGSLVDELQPGDVFIPDRVNEYLANSATVGVEEWTFQTSGNQLVTDPRLLNRFQLLSATQEDLHKRWRRKAQERFGKIVKKDTLALLKASGLEMRFQSDLYAGDDRILASGPAVGKGRAFVNWLKRQVDRKSAAIEMESAGVYDAALLRTPAPRAIAIRGISDFADERKAILEAVAKGGFRKLAVKNAITLFIAAVKVGLFAEDDALPSENEESSQSPPTESRVRSVFVIGGVTGETKHPDFETSRLQIACLELGRALASAGVQMIVCSPFPDSADYYAVTGYARSRLGGVIQFHSPRHPDVEQKHRDLLDILGDSRPEIVVWGHPGPENTEAWPQAWLLSQLQALEQADVVVAIGGKVSKTANTLLHLAEGRRLPVIPFTFLGGAAQRAFARYDWRRLHPNIDAQVLGREDGVGKVIELANQMLSDAVSFENRLISSPHTFFVSRAKEDSAFADELIKYLQQAGFEVGSGDLSISTEKMVQASIEQSILKSDVCIVLWSRHYALSPWCYDELQFSLERQNAGQLVTWLFNLDDSPIVAREARKLKTIKVKTVTDLLSITKELLLKVSREE